MRLIEDLIPHIHRTDPRLLDICKDVKCAFWIEALDMVQLADALIGVEHSLLILRAKPCLDFLAAADGIKADTLGEGTDGEGDCSAGVAGGVDDLLAGNEIIE